MTELERLLGVLTAAGVRFVVIGGVALVLRGSTRVTIDLDVCYARDRDNLRRLAAALAPYHPRLRGAPLDLPFQWDERTLASGLNFTLTTDIGDVDILGEVPGSAGRDRSRPRSRPGGSSVRVRVAARPWRRRAPLR